jgi:pyridoxine 5-phosphate synthase
MTLLSVNLNKVALLRNARDLDLPGVEEAAEICIAAGAHGITVHPRSDERHIRPRDVYALSELLRNHPGVEYNIEGNPFQGRFMDLVREVRPTQCTLVPDAPDQATSDHGWDADADAGRLHPVVQRLQDLGIRVSLFMDPDPAQIDRLPPLGADRIELYTEAYARAHAGGDYEAVLQRYAAAAARAQSLGLGVNAGHDLNLGNLAAFCAIDGILEVSIGHALIAEALKRGLSETVRAYLATLDAARLAPNY